MIRKFKCKDCGTSFSSEENGQVRCPNCGSDNVDYDKMHIPYKYIGIAICIVLMMLLLSKINGPTPPNPDDNNDNDTTVVDDPKKKKTEQEIEDLGIKIPPTIKGVENLEVDDSGNYNFLVKIDHAPESNYCVVITDKVTNEVIAKSENGVFTNVPYSKNDGKYDACIVNSSSDSPLSEKTEITGFVKIESISNRLSKMELQDLINKQDPSLLGHDNKFISPVCKIKYSNFPKGAEYDAPDNLGDVFELLEFGKWASVEVATLDYDDTKHISSITLKIEEASRPNFDN